MATPAALATEHEFPTSLIDSEANELYENQASRCLQRHENERNSIHSLRSEIHNQIKIGAMSRFNERLSLLKIKRNHVILAISVSLGFGVMSTAYLTAYAISFASNKFDISCDLLQTINSVAFVGYFIVSIFGVIAIIPGLASLWGLKVARLGVIKFLLIISLLESLVFALFSIHWWVFVGKIEM